MREWQDPDRNYEGIPNGETREVVEARWNAFHDALGKQYYLERSLPDSEKTAFIYDGKDYGILSKTVFDRLHGLIQPLINVDLEQDSEDDRAVLNQGIADGYEIVLSE